MSQVHKISSLRSTVSVIAFLSILVAASPCGAGEARIRPAVVPNETPGLRKYTSVPWVKILPTVLTNETPVSVYYDLGLYHKFRPIVTRDGARIDVRIWDTCDVCIVLTPPPPPTRIRVDLGAFQPGTYELSTSACEFGCHEVDSRALIVHDVTTLPMAPVAAPTTGSHPQVAGAFIANPFEDETDATLSFFEPADSFLFWVSFGGHGYFPIFSVPAHSSATRVDVGFEDTFGNRMVARNGFTYVDAPCTDPQMWEYFLVPVYYNGYGAFGSFWQTTLRLDGNAAATFIGGHVKTPETTCIFEHGAVAGPLQNHVTGFLLGVMRGNAKDLRATLRVSETSRHTLPVEIPVVHENDWFTGPTSIRNIPSAQGRRRLLRLWALDDELVRFRVSGVDIVPMAGTTSEPRFASIDLSAHATGWGVSIETVPPSGVRYWAMMTITDNQTQELATFVPKPESR